MSGLFVVIANPNQGSTVGRLTQVSGSISQINGALNSVSLQFGVGGPSVKITPPLHAWTFFWQGLLPNNVRPGQPFQLIVNAFGTMAGSGPEGEPTSVDGQAIANVVLENVVPVLQVVPFQTPIAVVDSQLPYQLTLRGTVSEGSGSPYTVPQVQYQIGNAAPTNLTVTQGGWSVPLSLPPGDYPITVRASDAFASVTTFQQTLSVLRYAPPAAPPTPSITSWTRLEPQTSDADMAASSNARLFDPLWFMTRQWQMGEFQAEDTGSPVQARVRATNAMLSRSVLGELSASIPGNGYDPRRVPLEPIVERVRMRALDANDVRMLPLAVEAGLHFLRVLDANPTGKTYRSAFLSRYALQPLPSQSVATADDATLRLVQTMAGRAPDARLIASAFRHPSGTQLTFDSVLNIAATDVAMLQQLATGWLAWYDGLFTESRNPAGDAWTPSRLEYAVSVATRLSALPQDGVTLSASEFDGGQLDWSSFDVNKTFNIDTSADRPFVSLSEMTIPAPVTFRGAPAARFWELEDASVSYGLVPVGPTDLAHLLMIEYASSYGNDWFIVPLTLSVGSLTRIDSLVVTDTFGVRSLLRPIGDPSLPAPFFSMWQCSARRSAGDTVGAPVPNLLFLPPTLGRSVDSGPLEDVLFMRDEMANLAWAIERTIESPTEAALNLFVGSASANDDPHAALPRYVLSSTVPDNWIPLLPVALSDQGKLVSRLKRGAMLQPDGTRKVNLARSAVLGALARSLLYDEEVPRAGVRITRRRRQTRWSDGSTWSWTAFRNQVGTGEGSAGLRFDNLAGDRASSP
jgi:hypothetical protein